MISEALLVLGALSVVAGAALLLRGRAPRVVARAGMVGAEPARLLVPVEGGPRPGPHQLELRLRIAPVEGYRLFARVSADSPELPPVIQVSDRPDQALLAPDDDPGPSGELHVVLGRLERPLLPGSELRVELSPVPPTRVERAVALLVRAR